MNCRLLVILLFFSVFGLSQNYVVKSYSVAEGLPQSQVYDILEDHNGQLWLATRGGGLARFNGKSFEVFTTKNGLVNNFVSSLFQDHRQNIWVGTSNGVSLYNGIRFRNYPLEGMNFTVSVASITEHANELYLGTSNGVYKRVKKEFKNISTQLELPGFSVTDVFFGKDSAMWVAHNKGVSRIKGEDKQHFRSGKLSGAYMQCFVEDRKGGIWMGSYGSGVFRYKDGRLDHLPQLDNLIVLDIYIEGHWLWISTLKNGVLQFNKKTQEIKRLKHSELFPTKNCRKVIKDSWGGYWIGTSGGGLIKYAQSPIRTYTNENGLVGNYVFAVTAAQDSGVWVSTGRKKLLKIKAGEIEEYGIEKNIYALKIKALLEDSKGRLWAGTEGEGLMMYRDGQTKFFKAGKELNSNFVRDILEDKEGNIWVATTNGISKFSSDLSEVERMNSGNRKIHYNKVSCLWEDRIGRVWYGTRGKGVGCIGKDSLRVLKGKDGLSHNSIRDITEDQKGNMFLGTAGAGIDVFNPYSKRPDFINLRLKEGLSSENIYNVICDSNNVVWVGADRGVDAITNPTRKERVIKNFGLAEGFTGVETCLRAATIDKEGNMWWGTINGLMQSAFHNYEGGKNNPKLSMSSVNLFYKNIQGTQYEPNILNWYTPNNLVLEYRDNHIGFKLNGVDLKHPEGIKYKWRLDGGSGRWTPANPQKEIFFSNLSPGNYIFQAVAVNKDGLESEELKFYFSVKAPFYFTLWFWTLVLALILIVVWRVVRFRIEQVKEKAREVNNRLLLEKEVLEMEQKALRLQMNPHFIFNALNAIQDQIRENNNKNARYSLMKFSKLMRQILEHSMEERISLEQEVALIENYLSIEKITRENSFDFEIEVAENIDVEEEAIPPMLIQPFLENAIIHGIAGKEENGLVKVNFDIQGDALVVIVEDNGVGREKAKELKSQRGQQHKSIALEVIQNRLENLSSESVKASYTVEDIKENELVKGTRVTLTISRGVVF